MDLSQIEQEVRELISEDALEEALDKIVQFAAENDFPIIANDASEIIGSLNKLRTDERKGILSYEDTTLQYNRIRNAITGQLEAFSAPKEESPEPPPEAPKAETAPVEGPSSDAEAELRRLILKDDLMYGNIIKVLLVVFIGFFIYYIFQAVYINSSIFFTASLGANFLRFRNRAKIVRLMQAAV